MMQLTTQAMSVAGFLIAMAFPSDDGRWEMFDEGVGDFFDDEVRFDFGDSCDKLWEVSYDGLLQLTVASDDAARSRFCAVSYPEDCVDQSSAVEGFGRLAPSRAEGYCRFIPEPIMRNPPLPRGKTVG